MKTIRLLLIGILFSCSSASALEATVKTKEVIEWVTVSKTYPESTCGPTPCLAIYSPVICNQAGTKYEVLVAEIDWDGKVKEVELERKEIRIEEALQRSTPCDHNFWVVE